MKNERDRRITLPTTTTAKSQLFLVAGAFFPNNVDCTNAYLIEWEPSSYQELL